MKLLLDQGLPRSTTAHLAAAGFASEHVGDLGLAAAKDREILDFAQSIQAVIVTHDADFHRLLAAAGAAGPSVIRLRLEGLAAAELAEAIARVAKVSASELQAGAAVSVTASAVRVRLLPIGRR